MPNRKEGPSDGAASVVADQPAIRLNQPQQGASQAIVATPVRIARMLQEIPVLEQKIRAWVCAKETKAKRWARVDGVLKFVEVSELVGDSLAAAKRERDEHIADLRHAIDYHLNTMAYKDVPCPTCRLPLDPLEFCAALPDFKPPAMQCPDCLGRGIAREKRTDPQSIADAKLVRYWAATLDDYIRCTKIKTGTPGADQAYTELEAANRMLLIKFGNEKQTPLEGADAEQGVRQGFIDAAIRFDPLKKKNGSYSCAVFTTVAYNWCRRNSRARHNGQKRAGLYAKSIESMGSDEEGNPAAQITSSEGAFGTFRPSTSVNPSLVLDLREKVEALPELERAVMVGELGGLSMVEIARQLSTTKAKVRQLRDTAYASLRGLMIGYVSTLHD